ncbi:MAG: hypothetical protein LBQ15_11180 [Clostridium sp.]|jgi:hypothetical protein|nr:hypothetical protein [Clostridium sp.]
MAIEWSSIEGYSEGMSDSEKLALLENQSTDGSPKVEKETEIEDETKVETKVDTKSASKMVDKKLFDKAASEVANLKRQLRAKMSEDEAKELDRQQEMESAKQELEQLRKEKTLTAYKASFLSIGYDDELASETADALAEGDMDAVFTNMKKYGANIEKALRAKILKETPAPPAGNSKDEKDKDPFIEAFKKG